MIRPARPRPVQQGAATTPWISGVAGGHRRLQQSAFLLPAMLKCLRASAACSRAGPPPGQQGQQPSQTQPQGQPGGRRPRRGSGGAIVSRLRPRHDRRSCLDPRIWRGHGRDHVQNTRRQHRLLHAIRSRVPPRNADLRQCDVAGAGDDGNLLLPQAGDATGMDLIVEQRLIGVGFQSGDADGVELRQLSRGQPVGQQRDGARDRLSRPEIFRVVRPGLVKLQRPGRQPGPAGKGRRDRFDMQSDRAG